MRRSLNTITAAAANTTVAAIIAAAITVTAVIPIARAQEAPKSTLAHSARALGDSVCKGSIPCETDFADLTLKAMAVELAASAAVMRAVDVVIARELKIDPEPAIAKSKEAQEHFQKLAAELKAETDRLSKKYERQR